MSPARQHRERHAAIATSNAITPIASDDEGGEVHIPAPARPNSMTPARTHQDRALAMATAAAADAASARTEAGQDTGTVAERATAQINLRMQHDLRRLRDIQSIEKKIEAKLGMLPEYAAWVDGLVAAGTGVEEDVLPTVMIWRIDTGDYDGALVLVEHVLAHNVPLPARYDRTAAAFIAEEIADAALKLQGAGGVFPLAILTRIDALTHGADMHDQIRAKLKKAIGLEQIRAADDEAAEPLPRAAAAALALETLRRAQQLNERVGVKDRIRKLEKMLEPPKELPAQSG